MSRLSYISSKPATYDLPTSVPPIRPQPPLSPPETEDTDVVHRSATSRTNYIPSDPIPPSTESPSARFRKISSLAYNQSSLREARQQQKKGPKWLIVVLPPPSISQEPVMLGHTFSTSPAARFNSGILMPLFPTLYAQLTAIAREFNMPSTTGLCLYLHVQQPNVNLKPRISDDTWQYLWTHLLDDPTPANPAHGPPIGGTIEFDIDVRKAKWFSMWMGVSRRPELEIPVMLDHSRRESQASFEHQSDVHPDTELSETLSLSRTMPSQHVRRIPRRLSLVSREREQEHSLNDQTTLGVTYNHAHVLSPVPQSEEPATAKAQDLVNRVTNWRDITSSSPAVHPLVHIGQSSLDPTNMPNSLPESPLQVISNLSSGSPKEPTAKEMEYELDLNDFAWSISSVGPQSTTVTEVLWPSPLSSVDFPRRIAGSVCLTPSVATSLGPADDDIEDTYYLLVDRLPTPDIAQRALSDAPCTPTTATSWGPPSPAYSLASTDETIDSIDIARRCLGSLPGTPSTATSWGPPSVYPESPASPFRARTPDLGERSYDRPPRDSGSDSPTHFSVFPYYDAWNCEPWHHVWPYTSHGIDSTGDEAVLQRADRGVSYSNSWKHGWSDITTVKHDRDLSGAVPGGWENRFHRYPFFDLYPLVYPHVEIYPGMAGGDSSLDDMLGHSSVSLDLGYPYLEPYPPFYPHVTPYPQIESGSSNPTLLVHASRYGYSEYPHFDLYPSFIHAHVAMQIANNSLPGPEFARYPYFDLYPAGYPHLAPYPEVAGLTPMKLGLTCDLHDEHCGYPLFDIYPSVDYVPPANVDHEASRKEKIDGYPHFDLYPSCYPFIEPYPAAMQVAKPFYYPSPVEVRLVPAYPQFDLYPAIYPWVEPYLKCNLTLSDPHRSLYAASNSGYPWIEPYPANTDFSPQRRPLSAIENSLTHYYPSIVPYPPQYPHIEIYPQSVGQQKLSMNPHLVACYPELIIYPASYPFVEPYRDIAVTVTPSHTLFESSSVASYPSLYVYYLIPAICDLGASGCSITLQAEYPNVVVYPPAYPNFAIYPDRQICSTSLTNTQNLVLEIHLPIKYPQIQTYPPVYPYIEPYPACHQGSVLDDGVEAGVSAYPYLQIYQLVYPFIEPYPPVSATFRRIRRRHIDLHRAVFPDEREETLLGKFSHAQLHYLTCGGFSSNEASLVPSDTPSDPGSSDIATQASRKLKSVTGATTHISNLARFRWR